jgi:hypothetical protein
MKKPKIRSIELRISQRYKNVLRQYRSTYSQRDRDVCELIKKVLIEDLYFTQDEISKLESESLIKQKP